MNRLDNIHPQEWVGFLEKAAAHRMGSAEGRQFLCINSKNDVALFQSKAEAKAAGFTKLTLKDTIKITQQKMKEVGQSEVSLRAALCIRALGMRKVQKHVADPARNTVSKVFHAIAGKDYAKIAESAKAAALEIHPHVEASVRAEQSAAIKMVLAHTTGMTRSAKGGSGVLFMETDIPQMLVIKPISDPNSVVAADRFLDAMGFVTPRSVAVSKESDEGKVIQERVGNLENKLKPEQRDQLKKQIQTNEGFLVMQRVVATAFEDLGPNEMEEALNDPQVLREIGEMIFLDMFINNVDRVNFSHCNSGNFMLCPPGGARRLALVDHEFHLNALEAPAIRANLEKLFLGGGDKKVMGFLLTKLITKFETKGIRIKVDENVMAAEIRKGILSAAGQLLKKYPDKTTFLTLLDNPGLPPSKKTDGKTIVEMLTFLEGLLAKGEKS